MKVLECFFSLSEQNRTIIKIQRFLLIARISIQEINTPFPIPLLSLKLSQQNHHMGWGWGGGDVTVFLHISLVTKLVNLLEQTETGLITISDQTVQAVYTCNCWFYVFFLTYFIIWMHSVENIVPLSFQQIRTICHWLFNNKGLSQQNKWVCLNSFSTQ